MNNKRKGTTLIEILVSVLLISFVMVFLFNILVNMKQEYNLTSLRSTDSLNRATYTRLIQNHLITTTGVKMSFCSSSPNRFCANIGNNFNTPSGYKQLVVENVNQDGKQVGRVIFDGEAWYLSSGTYNISDMKFTYIEQRYISYDSDPSKNSKILTDPNSDFHLLKIIIPVNTDILSNRKLDFELTHYGNNKMGGDSFCITAKKTLSTYIYGSNNTYMSNAKCINRTTS